MATENSVIRDVLTGGTDAFQPLPQTRRSAASIADEAEVLNRRTEWLHSDTSQWRRAAQLADLEDRQTRAATQQSGPDLLARLSEHGFAWTDIARLVGVTIPALQKWRRGAGITGANRLRLGRLVALMEMLEQLFVTEPASWLEMPIKQGVEVTGLDLLAADRYDLVLELARNAGEPNAQTSVLDEFDAEWRNHRVDSAFEVFTAADGSVAIRPRD